jgi:hypothetical protein
VQSLRYDDGVGYLMNLAIWVYFNFSVQAWLGKP